LWTEVGSRKGEGKKFRGTGVTQFAPLEWRCGIELGVRREGADKA